MEAVTTTGPDPRSAATVEPVEPEHPETPWGWFGSAAIAIAVAVLCFTPVWDEVTDAAGRRAWFSRLLDTLGPFTVAAVAALFALVSIVAAVRAMRRHS